MNAEQILASIVKLEEKMELEESKGYAADKVKINLYQNLNLEKTKLATGLIFIFIILQ